MKKAFNQKAFAAHLRAAILKSDTTQAQTAKVIGVPLTTLNKIMRGDNPNIENFCKVCKWLEIKNINQFINY